MIKEMFDQIPENKRERLRPRNISSYFFHIILNSFS